MSTNTVTVIISTEHASGGRESWWKHVKSVDASQKGGYAFDGDFLKKGEAELPVGSLLLHVTHCGSVKNGYQEGDLFAVDTDGSMREVVRGLNWREQAVTLRKAAEAYLAETAQAPEAPAAVEAVTLALSATQARLLARLVEAEWMRFSEKPVAGMAPAVNELESLLKMLPTSLPA